MYRLVVIFYALLSAAVAFAQNDVPMNISGRIPSATSTDVFQIQIGSFKNTTNAERAFERLLNASMKPVYEEYQDFTRVIVVGIAAKEVPDYLERLKAIGFSEVFIQIDSRDHSPEELPVSTAIVQEEPPASTVVPEELPVSTAKLPDATLHEIAHRSIKIGETKNLSDSTNGKEVVFWKSSTPETVSVDANGVITGLQMGNGFISINETEYIAIAVVPAESFVTVPKSEEALLPPESRSGETSIETISEYLAEPTFRLAYRFNNKGETKGASGSNGGIDILGRGPDYQWLWTTYYQGGWCYDLNGIRREMVDGFQKDARNGVELTIKPEFVYDDGVPYLQIRHVLFNPGTTAITGQRFGASADVMIHNNDNASLVLTDYGAYMTDSERDPSLELMFVCLSGNGIDPVGTLWLGKWENGSHLYHIYSDNRSDVRNSDSAIAFSYRNINLAPGEAKEFIVRFTLARTES